MSRNTRFTVDMIGIFLLCFLGIMAWGFCEESCKKSDYNTKVCHQRDMLLVKHEGWRWLGDKVIAMPPEFKNWRDIPDDYDIDVKIREYCGE